MSVEGKNNPNYRHGFNGHNLYWKWYGIQQRCYNEKTQFYDQYGGRGILMCDEWANDCVAFIKWALDNGWKKGLFIDRIDNDKGYSPENCRFVTPRVSSLNRSSVAEYPGVCRNQGKWRAYTPKINGKQKHIGLYITHLAACYARWSWEINNGFA